MTKQKRLVKSSGFTLIELLIVIAIIAVIAAVVFVALDPATRFQDSRNAVRWQDVTAIAEAIKIDQIDGGGSYLADIGNMPSNTVYQIGDGTTDCNVGCTSAASSTACVDVTGLVTNGYLAAIPVDPSSGNASTTGYTLERRGNTVIVSSCYSEGSVIAVSR